MAHLLYGTYIFYYKLFRKIPRAPCPHFFDKVFLSRLSPGLSKPFENIVEMRYREIECDSWNLRKGSRRRFLPEINDDDSSFSSSNRDLSSPYRYLDEEGEKQILSLLPELRLMRTGQRVQSSESWSSHRGEPWSVREFLIPLILFSSSDDMISLTTPLPTSLFLIVSAAEWSSSLLRYRRRDAISLLLSEDGKCHVKEKEGRGEGWGGEVLTRESCWLLARGHRPDGRIDWVAYRCFANLSSPVWSDSDLVLRWSESRLTSRHGTT